MATVDLLKQYRLSLARTRTHRPCTAHPTQTKRVCSTCERVLCPQCGHTCPTPVRPSPAPTPRAKRTPTQPPLPLTLPTGWPVIPGCTHLELSPDLPNAWRLHFAPTTAALSDLVAHFWAQPFATTHFVPTPFGATKTPHGWFLTVTRHPQEPQP